MSQNNLETLGGNTFPQAPTQALTLSHSNLSHFSVDESWPHPFTSAPAEGGGTAPVDTDSTSQMPFGPAARNPSTDADLVLRSPASSVADDGMSITSSTLPPSYRTHPSILDLRRGRPLPSPPPHGSGAPIVSPTLSMPPSTYRRRPRGSRSISRALMTNLHTMGWGRDTPPLNTGIGEGGIQETSGTGSNSRMNSGRRRSRDGGIRLAGGRPGSPLVGNVLVGVLDEGVGPATRPPPYHEDE